ncbi:EAL domain-containing protein [Marinomonas rhodophyticola]|uniref:EAL domain-containing protein n=1 Tax=Marinomonas rhodophyticola TaxID=2992803 RepID=A0ABT3KG42_9GAMM|nr:EAL domain-containing protein [Marinomonas sp. KJ51-3]MCW4629511.1 EAL domain-containing protein [Marinomonas sp. KJ51-3]
MPQGCFWSEAELRTYSAAEFKSMAGKSITLLFTPAHSETYEIKVQVEAFQLLGQHFCSLLIQDACLTSDDYAGSYLSDGRQPLSMAQMLKTDLQLNKLVLHYQPQINVSNNWLYGVEVLARWHHEELGHVSPDDFIALAENFGLIAELDLWVLREACRQLASWRKNNIQVPLIAVNFSPYSFNSPNLVDTIQSILQKNGLFSSDLVLEITESRKITLSDSFINVIDDLHSMGIAISLDDFGTGYSNLKRLLKFPVSQLKLDRAFVSKLPSKLSKELSDVVFSIGQKIGAVSIAEGVETLQQLSYLKAIGYEVIQGYLFSPPLSVFNFEEWYLKTY